MKIKALFSCLLLYSMLFVSGQNFNKTDFFEADMALLQNDYEKAQKTYEKLLRSEPDNPNLNFLNGLCLMNIVGRKKESIEFLKKATPFASTDYKYGSPKETNAPLEVLKYYAIASKLENNIPKAIELLNQYISLLGKDQDEIELANQLIESCYTAQKMQENPVYYTKTDLGSSLISDKSKQYPVVNHDETMLFYSVKGKYNKDDIYYSEKISGIWSEPVKITTYIGVKGECYPSSVSFDNERIYLTVKTGISSDIYYTFQKNKRWQKMIRLDKPVNGKDWDSDACESPDGRELYFVSDRKDGYGGMDIYRSEKDEKGKWEKPENLGDKINTKRNEIMPVINYDGTKLFFKSEGHENIGGYDIFYSVRTGSNEWETPVNIGYPLNTFDDDMYYMPSGNGSYAYVAMSDPAYDGNYNLYYLEILQDDPYKRYKITGQIAFQDGSTDFTSTNIEVISTETHDKIFSVVPDETDGNFSFELGKGNYMINFIAPEYNTYTHMVDFSSGYSEDYYYIYPFLEKTVPDIEEIAAAITPIEEKSEIVEPESTLIEEYESTDETAYESVVESVASETVTYDDIPDTEPVYDYENGKYTIQLMASVQRVEPDELNNSLNIEIQKGKDEYYRYVTGVYKTLTEAESAKNEIIRTKYKTAFIRYYNLEEYLNTPVRPTTYTIQVMALKREIALTAMNSLSDVKVSCGEDQIYRYTTGEYASLAAARNELKNVIQKGYKTAFIKATSDISNY